MTQFFKLLAPPRPRPEETECRIGLDVRVGGRQADVPLSGVCRSVDDVKRGIASLKEDLDRTLAEAEAFFGGPETGAGPDLPSDLSIEETWSVLAGLSDEEAFARVFNHLDEDRRRRVAEYVLTQCNVFSGRAAVFSARFDSDTALL